LPQTSQLSKMMMEWKTWEYCKKIKVRVWFLGLITKPHM
jgi:hypothetical protein